ncbi:prohead protease/major capsid protein fusion protein [Afifella sp. YEN Y35]|uniref:prohead protease/major capsid protein fusion protein n=1 Tax=Afifella sp. YEN Y35 TaxID=3388337 RepID=UPI0039E108D1
MPVSSSTHGAKVAALRTKLKDLEKRAKNKIAEIDDDTDDEAARRIEGEHQALLDQIAETRGAIETAEKTPPDDKDTRTPSGDNADEVRRAERRRISDIRSAVRDFGFEERDADPFIDAGQDINEVRAALQGRLAERSRREAPRTPPARTEPGGQDERETMVRLMGNALEHRLDPSTQLEEGAREYRGMTLIDMARECVSRAGGRTRGLTRMEIAEIALSPGDNMLARSSGLHSTSDFPIILGNQINRTLRRAYETAPRTYQRIARRATATDFRPIIRADIGANPRLLKVGEHGEFERGTIGEGKESYALDTFGRIIGVTRRVLVDDDLSAFDRIPSSWGIAASALENEIVWALITNNVTMGDGKALFHADHGNLASSGAIFSVDTVGAARTAMRLQRTRAPGGKRGEKGYLIPIQPNLLVVPAALETKAMQFVSPIVVPTADADVNPFKSTLDVLAEPLLDETSTAAWYLAADPGRSGVDTLEYAYLDGQEGVYTETRMGFDVDGVEFKARLDFGAGAMDYRGFYKNPGE